MFFNKVIGPAVIGNEPQPALCREHVVVPGAEVVHGIPLPAERAEHLIARSDIGGANHGIAVDIGIGALGAFAPRTAHIVRRRKRAERAHQIVIAFLRPLAVLQHGDILLIVQDAAFDRAACKVDTVIFRERCLSGSELRIISSVLAKSRGGVKLQKIESKPIRAVHQPHLFLGEKHLRIDGIGRAPACGRLHDQPLTHEGTERIFRLCKPDARF